MESKTLIKRLEEIRSLTGLPRERFSEALGFSPSYYNKLVKGEKKPGVDFLRKIVKAYPELRKQVIEYLGMDESTAVPVRVIREGKE